MRFSGFGRRPQGRGPQANPGVSDWAWSRRQGHVPALAAKVATDLSINRVGGRERVYHQGAGQGSADQIGGGFCRDGGLAGL